MPTVSLRHALHNAGTDSMRALAASTGSSETSLFRQAQIAEIQGLYKRNNGARGPLGFPVDDQVEFAPDFTATQDFSGGRIRILSETPQGTDTQAVRVRCVGWKCNAESKSDQLTGSDEPYFIIGVVGANGTATVRLGPYENVNSGSVNYDVNVIASVGINSANNIAPPIVVGVVAMEHDDGSPQEAEDGVRKVVEDVENKFDQVVGAFTGTLGENHVLPQWARDILGGWVPEGIAAVFGLADDKIGTASRVIFDNKADLKDWPSRPVQGTFGANEWTDVINIDGGDEGNYDIYFKVDLFHIEITLTP